jgi:signal transduction histidine kinase
MSAGMVGGLRKNRVSDPEGYMGHRKSIIKTKSELYLVRIAALFAACSLLYYLPTIIGLAGGTGAQNELNRLHDFYGIDFFALIFFVPVVYAAYSVGVIKAVFTAFLSMAVFIPYSLFITNQPAAFFRPTAFVLILSAVGAVVAMLQRGDDQRRRSMNELKCLYDIGKAAESSYSIEKFISSVVSIIPQDLNQHGEIEVSINFKDKTCFDLSSGNSKHRVKEDILVAGEVVGYLEVVYPSVYSWDKKSDHFIKTLAERISGAIHGIELEQSLKLYYEQLEEMVESRTRELEQAQEKLIRSERLAAVGELASGVGHELRNPLNVIRNCVYLINMNLDCNATAEVTDTLKLLDTQVDISNKIVSDLLDFTRVKVPTRTNVNLNNMARERVSWASIPEKVKVTFDLTEDTPQIFVDVEQVGRAFTNIINNAVQSMNNCGEFRISTGTQDSYAWIKFTDGGCGISQENLYKIFEPLFTTKPKGIGLGLAISKRMVEQNSGEIEVESTVGKGTTFTLKLPLIKKEAVQYETASQYSGR